MGGRLILAVKTACLSVSQQADRFAHLKL